MCKDFDNTDASTMNYLYLNSADELKCSIFFDEILDVTSLQYADMPASGGFPQWSTTPASSTQLIQVTLKPSSVYQKYYGNTAGYYFQTYGWGTTSNWVTTSGSESDYTVVADADKWGYITATSTMESNSIYSALYTFLTKPADAGTQTTMIAAICEWAKTKTAWSEPSDAFTCPTVPSPPAVMPASDKTDGKVYNVQIKIPTPSTTGTANGNPSAAFYAGRQYTTTPNGERAYAGTVASPGSASSLFPSALNQWALTVGDYPSKSVAAASGSWLMPSVQIGTTQIMAPQDYQLTRQITAVPTASSAHLTLTLAPATSPSKRHFTEITPVTDVDKSTFYIYAPKYKFDSNLVAADDEPGTPTTSYDLNGLQAP